MILVDFLVESSLPRWLTIFKFNNIVGGKSLTVISYDDSAAFVTLCSEDEKINFSSEFCLNSCNRWTLSITKLPRMDGDQSKLTSKDW